jgi:predicted DNA-binding transcriptional regulator AlpA
MSETRTAAVEPNNSTNALPLPPGHVLIDVRTVAKKYGVDARSVYRWADAGLIPFGIKLSSLRRWDAAEIDAHIAGGCKPVRAAGKGVRA